MKNILILLVVLIVIGCSNNETKSDVIDKNKLTVIEGIQLGTSIEGFYKQMDSLGIKKLIFYTKFFLQNSDELIDFLMQAYNSEIFNLSQFKSNVTNHNAFIIPKLLEGTQNVYGINVILGFTNPVFLMDNSMMNVTEENGRFGFNQNISKSLADKIKEMLISKYGNPILDGQVPENTEMYVFEGNTMNVYNVSEEWNGKITTWETDYIEIELFEGLPSTDAKCINNVYSLIFDSEGVIKDFDLSKGEEACVTYLNIKYRLKSELIEKLKLNDIKL